MELYIDIVCTKCGQIHDYKPENSKYYGDPSLVYWYALNISSSTFEKLVGKKRKAKLKVYKVI